MEVRRVQVWFGAETRGEGAEGTRREIAAAIRKIAKVRSCQVPFTSKAVPGGARAGFSVDFGGS